MENRVDRKIKPPLARHCADESLAHTAEGSIRGFAQTINGGREKRRTKPKALIYAAHPCESRDRSPQRKLGPCILIPLFPCIPAKAGNQLPKLPLFFPCIPTKVGNQLPKSLNKYSRDEPIQPNPNQTHQPKIIPPRVLNHEGHWILAVARMHGREGRVFSFKSMLITLVQ